MNYFNKFVALSALAFLTFSCESDDDADYIVLGDYEEGLIISHEGGFSSSGTTAFVDNQGVVTQDIYNLVNDEQLGSFQQSISFTDEHAYIVVDNQNTITKVNRYTFEKEAAITGLANPRYMAIANGFGYVTNWNDPLSADDDFVAVVDLATNEVVNTIDVAEGPEQAVVANNKLYVSNKGGWGFNNLVTVIDLATESVLTEIEVAYLPDELLVRNNKVWVASEGAKSWHSVGETTGAVTVINSADDSIVKTYTPSEVAPINLFDYDASTDTFYYTVGSAIYTLAPNAQALPETALTTAEGSLYGFRAKDNVIYAVDPLDYASEGLLYVYPIATGAWEAPVTLDLVPAKIYFN